MLDNGKELMKTEILLCFVPYLYYIGCCCEERVRAMVVDGAIERSKR